jgi:hypothetical protein
LFPYLKDTSCLYFNFSQLASSTFTLFGDFISFSFQQAISPSKIHRTAMSHNDPHSASAQAVDQEKGISDSPPAFAPASKNEDAVMANEEAELIDYKTLTWWYV